MSDAPVIFEGLDWQPAPYEWIVGRLYRGRLPFALRRGLAAVETSGRTTVRTRVVLETRLLIAPTNDSNRPYALTERGVSALQKAHGNEPVGPNS